MKLIFLTGRHAGRSELLAPSGTVIGRAPDCTIALEDDGISRHHCRISLIEGQWVIEDLGSLNGVAVNGMKTSGVRVLRAGDRISLLETTLQLAEEGAEMPVPGTPRPPEAPAAGGIPKFEAALPDAAMAAEAAKAKLKVASPAELPRPLAGDILPDAATNRPPALHLAAQHTAAHPPPAATPRSALPWVRLLLLGIVVLLLAVLVYLLRQPFPSLETGVPATPSGKGPEVWTARPLGSEAVRYVIVPVPAGASMKFIPEGRPLEAVAVPAEVGRIQSFSAEKGRLEILQPGNLNPIVVELDPGTPAPAPKPAAP